MDKELHKAFKLELANSEKLSVERNKALRAFEEHNIDDCFDLLTKALNYRAALKEYKAHQVILEQARDDYNQS